jgi:hypothetical protein
MDRNFFDAVKLMRKLAPRYQTMALHAAMIWDGAYLEQMQLEATIGLPDCKCAFCQALRDAKPGSIVDIAKFRPTERRPEKHAHRQRNLQRNMQECIGRQAFDRRYRGDRPPVHDQRFRRCECGADSAPGRRGCGPGNSPRRRRFFAGVVMFGADRKTGTILRYNGARGFGFIGEEGLLLSHFGIRG